MHLRSFLLATFLLPLASQPSTAQSISTPALSLECTPKLLTDTQQSLQIATCTVTASSAVTNAVRVNISHAAIGTGRYSDTCALPFIIPAGSTSGSCSIKALGNDLHGDGSISAAVAILPATNGEYVLSTTLPTSDVVTILDDDPLPELSFFCINNSLVDRSAVDGQQVATCRVITRTANASQLTILIQPPPPSTRYTTTCSSTLELPAGSFESSTCTITATENNDANDGNIAVSVELLASPLYTISSGTAHVFISDDDTPRATTPVPVMPPIGLAILSLLIASLALFIRRR